jgi:transketolase
MTHKALKIAKEIKHEKLRVGVIDVFLLKPIDEEALFNILKSYKYIFTLEEAFVNKGGLDSLISDLLHRRKANNQLISFGFQDCYIFKSGNRDFLSETSHFGEKDIIKAIREIESLNLKATEDAENAENI